VALRLIPEAREAIAQEYEKVQEAQNPPNKEQIVKEQIVLDWVEHRGRVNTTELCSIIGMQPTNLGRSMKKLEQAGLIAPGRENRGAAGFSCTQAR
jgi:ATP-dependent DNA helicase RecG